MIKRLFIPRYSWQEPLRNVVVRQYRQTPQPQGAFFLAVANSLPHSFLLSRVFRGIKRRFWRYKNRAVRTMYHPETKAERHSKAPKSLTPQGKTKRKNLNQTHSVRFRFLLAEQERFELSRRYSRPTPLAGAPLHHLSTTPHQQYKIVSQIGPSP